MFKRMSILVRRGQDDRPTFAQGWRNHAELISDLPGVRAYQQNHVVEDFISETAQPLAIDGIVELRFDSPEAMAEAFKSPAAKAMAADEPNFLGHGSGYALTTDGPLRPAEDGAKLIVALTGRAAALSAFAEEIAGLEHLAFSIADNVSELIAKPSMSPPQPVDLFIHLHFDTAEAATRAGQALAVRTIPEVTLDVVRVRTITIV